MPITSSLRRSIGSRQRKRGEDCFREGRVAIQETSGGEILARVRDSRRHLVTLQIEDDALLCECDCRYFQDNVEPCKHVWASALAAEQQGLLPAGNRLTELVPFEDDLADMEIVGEIGILGEEEDPLAEEADILDDSPFRAPWKPPRRGPPADDLSAALRGLRDLREAGELSGRPRRPAVLSAGAGATPRKRHAGRPGVAPAESRPSTVQRRKLWKASLETLRSSSEIRRMAPPGFEHGRREILYVVNLPSAFERQSLTLEILRRDRKIDGGWSKPRPLALHSHDVEYLPESSDRRILSLLRGVIPPYMRGYSYGYEKVSSEVDVPGPAAELLLQELCASGRCLVRRDEDAEPVPLKHEGGDPWRFHLEVKGDAAGQDYVVTGHIERAGVTMPLERPGLFLEAGLFFDGDCVRRLDHGNAFSLLLLLRRAGRLEVPRSDGTTFVSGILEACGRLPVALPEELRFEESRIAPSPSIRILRPKTTWRLARLDAIVTFDYAGHALRAGTGPAVLIDRESRRVLPRDLEAEKAALDLLHSLGVMSTSARDDNGPTHDLASRRLPSVVPALLRAGWRVEAEGKLYRAPSSFRIEVVSGIDWFELRGGASYDGVEIPLPALLAALKKGEPTVALGDGGVGLLPEEWLRRFVPVAGLGEGEKDHVRFTRAQAGFLDALLAAEPEATCDEVFERVRSKLRAFDGVKPEEAPPGFRGVLRPYQKEGLGWLRFLRDFGFGGCLADDMGLGKTVQVLALLEALRTPANLRAKKPSLVVAPRSVVFNWIDEARRFAPRLRVLDHTGLTRTRSKEDLLAPDVVLTTYGTLRRDIAILKEIAFDTIVLDEAQAIKNAGTDSAKAVRLLRGDQRLALSGTPIENHLGELWSLFEFLNPGMLGASSAFQAGLRAGEEPDGPARALLARALRPFILRRSKAQVTPDLPEKTEQTLTCELTGPQRSIYREILDHYRASLLARVQRDGLSRSKLHVLEALLRLRQAACHPGLLDPKKVREGSAKFEVLFAQLDEVLEEGHKALVFSQFTSLLSLVKHELDARKVRYAYLDGSTRSRMREAAVRRFQEDARCPLFLLSLKAGGYGLNLTAAEYVYLLDPWWNPAVEAQAVDRTHRIGQTRPVFAYRIVAKDTIEEKILALQASKRELADSILAADASLMRSLTREDLELLLS